VGKIWRLATTGQGQSGRDGAPRRPLAGAFPSAAGQPCSAGQSGDCASGDIAAQLSLPPPQAVAIRKWWLTARCAST